MRCALNNLIFKDIYPSAPTTKHVLYSGSEHSVFGYEVILTILTKVK